MMQHLLAPPKPAALSGVSGIVRHIVQSEMHRGDPDVFVVAAQTANLRAYGLPHEASSDGSGAGLRYTAARDAAIGECIERYACGIVHPEALVFGSYADLRAQGEQPVAPDDWALFAPEQYATAPYAPFEHHTPLGWLRAADLRRWRTCLVPACLVYMPYSFPFADQGEVEIATAISTGAACAPRRAEALLKGLCELVERDAFMIMWRNQLRCPRLRIDPAGRLGKIFARHFARPGLRFELFDTRLDLAIPSFCGVMLDERRNPPAIMVGGAAHPDPERAALKTLLELVQGLKWLDHMGPRPIDPGPDYQNIRDFEDRVRLYAFGDMQPALDFLLAGDQTIDLADIPALGGHDPSADLGRCVELLAAAGMDVYAVDITPSDAAHCGYSIIKMLIPQAETMEADHRLPFLGGRRRREVPAALKRTAGVNPYPHPYP
jgi:ribosomal protein S12 methylthiotransferase accessory factor